MKKLAAILALLAALCVPVAAQETFPAYVGALTQATTPLLGTEQTYVLQNGFSRRTPVSSIQGTIPQGTTCINLSLFQQFVNTTGAPQFSTLNFWDGTQCVSWASLNQTTHNILFQSPLVIGGPLQGQGGVLTLNGLTSGSSSLSVSATGGNPSITGNFSALGGLSSGANGGTGGFLTLNGATSGVGTINVTATGGTTQVSSGQTTGFNESFKVFDAIPGNTVDSLVSNSSSANSSEASITVATGTANVLAALRINNQTGTPFAKLLWGSGVTGGLALINNATTVGTINNGWQIGAAPSGGDKGAGTINAAAGIFTNTGFTSGTNGGTGGSLTLNGATSGNGAITVDAAGGVLRAPTLSMRQVIGLSAQAGTLPQNTTGFMTSGGICTATTCTAGAELSVTFVAPIAGTFKNLQFNSASVAAGQTVTATWRVNNINTAITCTITGPASFCNDFTHTATITAGQGYDLQIVTSATSGTQTLMFGGIEFDNP